MWRGDLTDEDRIRLIEATTEQFADDAIPAEIMRRLWDEHSPACVAAIENVYDSLAAYPDAQEKAIRVLTEMMSDDSPLLAVTGLLKRESSRSISLETVFVPLTGGVSGKTDPHGMTLIENLLDDFAAYEHLEHRPGIYELLLTFANEGLLDFNAHPKFVSWSIQYSKRFLDDDLPLYERLIQMDPRALALSSERIKQVNRSATEF